MPRVPLDTTEVITTVRLVGDPEWRVADMTDTFGMDALLIQTEDGNIGIVGTRERINTMLDRLQSAVAESAFTEEAGKTA